MNETTGEAGSTRRPSSRAAPASGRWSWFRSRAGRDLPDRDADARVEEAVGLARAIDLDVVEGIAVPLAAPRPATLFGTGKVDEIGKRVEAEKIGLVIVDRPLSPVQQRNLERAWKTKVIDRTGLILEIFGERAQTREGRLQVELAHLNYQKSRLVRSWTHLERQRGGFGFLGGPGETQIEADRRVLSERIAQDQARARDGGDAPPPAAQEPAAKAPMPWSPWSATPMPASRRCSMR